MILNHSLLSAGDSKNILKYKYEHINFSEYQIKKTSLIT